MTPCGMCGKNRRVTGTNNYKPIVVGFPDKKVLPVVRARMKAYPGQLSGSVVYACGDLQNNDMIQPISGPLGAVNLEGHKIYYNKDGLGFWSPEEAGEELTIKEY